MEHFFLAHTWLWLRNRAPETNDLTESTKSLTYRQIFILLPALNLKPPPTYLFLSLSPLPPPPSIMPSSFFSSFSIFQFCFPFLLSFFKNIFYGLCFMTPNPEDDPLTNIAILSDNSLKFKRSHRTNKGS